ncbi:hypothetical protein WJX73_008024 [Symbiochloris irregularis]|uniref:Uncharacterized protein n=1 Tax=Symbiochloris irregularis TaxID=706552 RepID=A0AAW1P4A1_9CHLO
MMSTDAPVAPPSPSGPNSEDGDDPHKNPHRKGPTWRTALAGVLVVGLIAVVWQRRQASRKQTRVRNR